MASGDFEMALKMADRITAQEMLMQIRASAYPHAKADWQTQLYRELDKIANPRRGDSLDRMSTEDLARMLSGGG
jgi:hypothetical protein